MFKKERISWELYAYARALKVVGVIKSDDQKIEALLRILKMYEHAKRLGLVGRVIKLKDPVLRIDYVRAAIEGIAAIQSWYAYAITKRIVKTSSDVYEDKVEKLRSILKTYESAKNGGLLVGLARGARVNTGYVRAAIEGIATMQSWYAYAREKGVIDKDKEALDELRRIWVEYFGDTGNNATMTANFKVAVAHASKKYKLNRA
jgi:hypothetical protein